MNIIICALFFYEFQNKQPAEICFFHILRHQVLFNGSLHILSYFDMMNCAPKLFLGLCGRYSQAFARRTQGVPAQEFVPISGPGIIMFSCWFWKIAHWSCSSDPRSTARSIFQLKMRCFSFQLPCLLITHPDDTAIKSIPHSIPSYPNSFSLYHH